MKKCKILPLLGILFLMSSIFSSCKEARDVEAPSKIPTDKVLVKLKARLVKEIPIVEASTSSTSRGVTLGSERDGGVKKTPIQWTSDTWDENHQPQLVCVVRSKSTPHIVRKSIKLGSYDYEYHRAKRAGDEAYVQISTLIDKADFNTDELVFYLFDSSRYGFHTDGYDDSRLSFDGGATLYDVTTNPGNPSSQNRIDSNVFVEPNRRVYFDFIFSGTIDYSRFASSTYSDNAYFDMYPVGSLLMVDFKTNSGEMTNPGDIPYFYPTLITNAFDLDGVLNLSTGYSFSFKERKPINKKIIFASYNPDDNSTVSQVNTSRKIDNTTPSPIYVKYVLPRDLDQSSTIIKSNGKNLYSNYSVGSFFARNNSKRVGYGLIVEKEDIPQKSISPEYKYNALAYMAERSVNSTQDGFTTDPYDYARLSFDDVESSHLFDKEFLKGYHLPSAQDWRSIFQSVGHANNVKDHTDVIFFGDEYYDGTLRPEPFTAKIGDASLSNIKSIFYPAKDVAKVELNYYHAIYALRYISATVETHEGGKTITKNLTEGNCPYLSLWRYSFQPKPGSTGYEEFYVDVYCYVVPKVSYIDKDNHMINLYDGKGAQDFTTVEFFENSIKYGGVHRILYPRIKGYEAGSYLSSTMSDRPGNILTLSWIQGENIGIHEGYATAATQIRPFLNPIE